MHENKRHMTALIMAGGRGERFWPKSRKNLPKQFLTLTDDGKTMLQLTVERIHSLVKMDDIYVVTNQDYKYLVQIQIPDLPEENILCEPMGRNTAPCIGLGAVHISLKYEDSLMLVLPSDHLIKYNELFLETLYAACDVAEKEDNMVTIGITPDYPETGYGYIKFKPEISEEQAYEVECFVEKPDIETAKKYLTEGGYLWNSGMFVWKVSTILKNFKKYLPQMYSGLIKIRDAIKTIEQEVILQQEFTTFRAESIDYGIMEKADHIYVIPGEFGWDDVGSWLAIERIRKSNESGNVVNGNIITIDTNSCIIEGSDHLIATVGLSELIIVGTKDATLICNKHNTNEIKMILEKLKISNKEEYL